MGTERVRPTLGTRRFSHSRLLQDHHSIGHLYLHMVRRRLRMEQHPSNSVSHRGTHKASNHRLDTKLPNRGSMDGEVPVLPSLIDHLNLLFLRARINLRHNSHTTASRNSLLPSIRISRTGPPRPHR
jgi:hypothetical protein